MPIVNIRNPACLLALMGLAVGAAAIGAGEGGAASPPRASADGGVAEDTLGLRRAPVPGKRLDYSPADGSVAEVNPPPFRWIPATVPDAVYTLEVAKDAGFADPAYRAEALKWRIDVPTEPFAPGRYWWRFGLAGADGAMRWSDARSFTVPEDAPVFAFPAPGYVDAIPREHPRILFTPDVLPALRRSAEEGSLRAPVKDMARDLRPRYGEALVPEPAMLPKERQARVNAYVDIMRSTRKSMDMMERSALAYLLAGDREAGEDAKRRLLHFLAWDPAGSTSVGHNDEPAMGIMLRAPLTYDWVRDLLTEEERALCEEALMRRGRDMFKLLTSRPFDSNPFESHAGRMTGLLGMASVLLAPEHEEARVWLDYVLRIYYGAYPCWGGAAGGWNEGPDYWNSYMLSVLSFVATLKFAGVADLTRKPFFRNTPYYLYYSAPPFQRRRAFGDGAVDNPVRSNGGSMRRFAILNRDPRLKYFAEASGVTGVAGRFGLGLRLSEDDGLESRPPDDLSPSRFFPDVGLVALRNTLTDGERHVGMLFQSNPFGNVSHGHNAQNAFAVEAFGEPLAISTGYYDYYGSAHHNGWTRQTKSKNAITVDGGQGQERGWNATGAVTRFVDGPDIVLAAGDATPSYGALLSRAVREIVFIKPAGVFVIRDELASERERKFEFRLHALDRMDVDDASARVVINRPRARLHVDFLWPDAPAFEQSDLFDVPVGERKTASMVDNWHLTVSTGPATSTRFVTVLSALRPDDTPPTVQRLESGTALGARIRAADGRTWLVGFAKPDAAGEVELDGLRSTERFFAEEIKP